MVSADPEALADLRARALAPLADLRPAAAERLAETLRSWLLHQGRRDAVAAELHVHPQTVRYRMGQLRELYGDRLDDPRTVLELVLALRPPTGAPRRTGRNRGEGPRLLNQCALEDGGRRSRPEDGTPCGRCSSAAGRSAATCSRSTGRRRRSGRWTSWPQSLQSVVRLVLTSRFSMWMAWGPELTFFCNDAYRRDTLGEKYPWALGRPAQEVWSEIWHDIGPRIEAGDDAPARPPGTSR